MHPECEWQNYPFSQMWKDRHDQFVAIIQASKYLKGARNVIENLSLLAAIWQKSQFGENIFRHDCGNPQDGNYAR